MKEKMKKIFRFIYKLAILGAIFSLYIFLFEDLFDVYDSLWYALCATFLTIIYLVKAEK